MCKINGKMAKVITNPVSLRQLLKTDNTIAEHLKVSLARFTTTLE